MRKIFMALMAVAEPIKHSSMQRAILLMAAACCLFACEKPDQKPECSVVTVEPGVSAEELAAINAGVGESKVCLEEGLFDTILSQYTQKDMNIIPNQATASSADTLRVNGYPVLKLTPERITNSNTVILYIHGGAYLFAMSTVHIQMVDELASRLGVVAYMPSYPLVGQVQYQVAHDMVRALYKQLTGEGKKVLLMGDSAGGGLALALAQWAQENKLDMPARMVLLSPWLDVTMTNPEIAKYEAVDVSLDNYGLRKCGQRWAGLEDYDEIKKNTQVCPLYGKMSGLPATLLFVGTAEVMCPDVTLLYEKLKAQGISVRLVYGKDLFHVYPVYCKKLDLPAANTAVDQMCTFLQ